MTDGQRRRIGDMSKTEWHLDANRAIRAWKAKQREPEERMKRSRRAASAHGNQKVVSLPPIRGLQAEGAGEC